ncbi:DNA topoisomerase 1 [Geodia barretti]|uniref:DNA topoisomerase 1 n=1 Tax=Geodia barretti TaxID=519541 RepID=A0AA35RJQ5_GEOBA|nr:DNA topoisomerase 1 [Geodia barretti]
MGIEIDDRSFEPTYRVVNGKGKIISDLAKEAKQANTVYLATDPDREGEAISWHLMEAAKIPPNKGQAGRIPRDNAGRYRRGVRQPA